MSEFVRYPDPRLSVAAEPKAHVDAQMLAVGERLLAAAKEARAYGLAAVHIGEAEPIVVISADSDTLSYQLLFNPRVMAVATDTIRGEEGSVSLPGVRVEIERPVWAEIDYMDADGARKSTRFEGFAARVALHEIEQTRGVFFLDKLSRLKREIALKKAKKRPG